MENTLLKTNEYRRLKTRGWFFCLAAPLCLFLLLLSGAGWAESLASGAGIFYSRGVGGQVVYVPVYSHIFIGDRETPFLLTATVLVRNTDLHHSIQGCSADYHESKGQLVKPYLIAPVRLPPLATTHFIIPESETIGGAGASVIVTWKADVPVNPPIIESVMIGTRSQQGISFPSRGQVLDGPINGATAASQTVSIEDIKLREP